MKRKTDVYEEVFKNDLIMAESVKELISSEVFKELSRKSKKYFTRKRKMDFERMIYFIMDMIKSSTDIELKRFFKKLDTNIDMCQSSFCEGRKKLKPEVFILMLMYMVNKYYEKCKDIKSFYDMKVIAIDGTTISLPDVKETKEYYGTSGKGHKSPTARGSFAYDIMNNIIIDACIEPMNIDERTMAKMHIDKIIDENKFVSSKCLFIFDRGYMGRDFFQYLHKKGVKFLVRLRVNYLELNKKYNYGNHIIDYPLEDEIIKLRIIKLKLEKGNTEMLITNLVEKEYNNIDFGKTYFCRWKVETKIGELKVKQEIENFSSRSVENIKQEFYATMVVANLFAELVKEGNKIIAKEQKYKRNKLKSKVNISKGIGILKDDLIKIMCENDEYNRKIMFENMIIRMTMYKTPIRLGRKFPRKEPRKARFHSNIKSNC